MPCLIVWSSMYAHGTVCLPESTCNRAMSGTLRSDKGTSSMYLFYLKDDECCRLSCDKCNI